MSYLTVALTSGRLPIQTIELPEKIGVSRDGIHDYRKTHKLIFVDENYGLSFLIVGGPDVPAYAE